VPSPPTAGDALRVSALCSTDGSVGKPSLPATVTATAVDSGTTGWNPWTGTAREVAGAVEALRASIADSERDFALELYAPDDAVARAKQRGELVEDRVEGRHLAPPGRIMRATTEAAFVGITRDRCM